MRLCAEGMSEMRCDRSIVVGDYLSPDETSRLYVYHGPAGRISNKYYMSNNVYHQVVNHEDTGNRSTSAALQ